MFSHKELDDDGTVVEVTYLDNDCPITAEQFFTHLQNKEFALNFSKRLASQNFDAAFWECPAFSNGTASLPFHCVLISSLELAGKHADPSPFTRKLAAVANNDSGVFPNIDNTATLISPQVKTADYGHLLAFLRKASAQQITNFWSVVGKQAIEKISDKPLWISTSGLGVPWLHVRLDSKPKYYRHTPYKAHPIVADGDD